MNIGQKIFNAIVLIFTASVVAFFIGNVLVNEFSFGPCVEKFVDSRCNHRDHRLEVTPQGSICRCEKR